MKNALLTLFMFAALLVTTSGETQAQDYYYRPTYYQPAYYQTTYYRSHVVWMPQTTWLTRRPRTFGFGFSFGFYRTPRVQTFRWQHVPHRHHFYTRGY